MFKLAMAQMLVVGGQPERNLAHAGEMIASAAGQGAAVVLLPECMDLGWLHPSAKQLAGDIPEGATCQFLRNAARRHRVYVCSGLVEHHGDLLYNAAVLFDPAGELVLQYRKLNELILGHDLYAQGDRIRVAHTPLGTLGLMICADGFAEGEVVSRAMGYMGADIVLSPSAWGVPPEWDVRKHRYGDEWRQTLGPVARDFSMWIAAVSCVGTFRHPAEGRDHPCIGNSLVFNPEGRDVLVGPFGQNAEALLTIDIELRPRPARGCGWKEHWDERDGIPVQRGSYY
jgi:predicted amidohydrolase